MQIVSPQTKHTKRFDLLAIVCIRQILQNMRIEEKILFTYVSSKNFFPDGT